MPNNPPDRRWFRAGHRSNNSDDRYYNEDFTREYRVQDGITRDVGPIPGGPTGYPTKTNEEGEVEIDFQQQHYVQLLDRHTLRDVADLFRRADNSMRNSLRNGNFEYAGANAADDRLSRICSAAKAEDIRIYAIAFEAPSRGITAMKDCATSIDYFFNAEGSDLREVFIEIAGRIRQLRLTQ